MSKYRNEAKITELIIHCAATPNGKWFDAVDIDAWHAKRKFTRNPALVGYNQPRLTHIGYHFIINLNGGVQTGRGLTETGAHARGHNGISIGTCLIGRDKFTEDQWLALKQHVEALQNRFPGIRVIGHREINSHKSCPGFDVPTWLAGGKAPLTGHISNGNGA